MTWSTAESAEGRFQRPSEADGRSWMVLVDFDEALEAHDVENCSKILNKHQTDDDVQSTSNSSVLSYNSSLQTRRFNPVNSASFQRNSFSSIGKRSINSDDKENKTLAEKLNERVYVRLEEINKKLDIVLMNQGRFNRSLLPNEKRFQKPANLPDLPIKTEDQLNLLETYLQDDNNFTSMCDYLSSFIISKDIAKSTVRIAVKLLTNSVASTMSFKGQNKKKPFYKLKIREAIQGSLLIKFDNILLFEAEETMKSWLANAPWRKQDDKDGKRTKKTR
ncbi:PREDICTED: uncharacterized protein LOC108777163 [Cyphomyrmex costatus]|uniref:uncharacterized protein LOC108777163 n=1 Tax=Cyphomyrmex costatus TaxID=456900 RepID=UPI0008522425|nr:PREDICTED: uncharacterized protein LOC108777163 [Cyphomyrmex costatus]